jgi:hypothetical protein
MAEDVLPLQDVQRHASEEVVDAVAAVVAKVLRAQVVGEERQMAGRVAISTAVVEHPNVQTLTVPALQVRQAHSTFSSGISDRGTRKMTENLYWYPLEGELADRGQLQMEHLSWDGPRRSWLVECDLYALDSLLAGEDPHQCHLLLMSLPWHDFPSL